ncbi:hypothetical protein GDO81_009944 [Engystomops pustulosus]|uniref:Uncharacterized protein n=1 Tax=Engystomops pustulosus TaxID=76066 RepID=A0AAV7BVL1_ENGPU|nr:hypothetical protein GDO81_009944 [Engystomops pustulosus]
MGSRKLSQVIRGEHALGSAQYRVLVGVIGVLLRWDFKHSGNGEVMCINSVPDHLSNKLVDQYNANIITLKKTPGGEKKKKRFNKNYNIPTAATA